MKILCSLLLFTSGLLPASAEMIGYYPFETDFSDQSGKGNHATARGIVSIDTLLTAAVGNGSAAFANGVNGGGVNLLSVNDATGGLNLTSLPVFTLSIWFNSTADQTDRRIFSEASTLSNNPLYNLGTGAQAANNNKLDFYRRTPGGGVTNNHQQSTETPFETGTWHNVILIDNSGAVDLYIDGAFSRSFAYVDSDLLVNTTTFGGILRATPLAGFTGNLDDIGIWNEAPTDPAAFASAIASGAPANTVPINVPEPATGVLSLLTLGGLAVRRRR